MTLDNFQGFISNLLFSFLLLFLVSPTLFANDLAGQQADAIIANMTLDQKIQLTHGDIGCTGGYDGTVPGIPSLNIPTLHPTDAPSGVRLPGCPGNPNYPGPNTTDLPVSLAMAASFDPLVAYIYGDLIGREVRDIGFNWNLGGNVNLVREPRAGRVFETMGEDPIHAGEMVVPEIVAIQAHDVIGTIKHFALNDQETNRYLVNVNATDRTMRESDLLPFEMGVKESGVLSILCAYNSVNDAFNPIIAIPGDITSLITFNRGWGACGSDHLLNDILKNEWGFEGFVHTDYNFEPHDVTNANAGVDMDEPGFSLLPFFGYPYDPRFRITLKPAVLGISDGQPGNKFPIAIVPVSRLNDMVHRILRAMIIMNLQNNPPIAQPVNQQLGNLVAQFVEEQSAVLLKNQNNLLPLNVKNIHSIAVIGSHADIAVLNGGGSGNVPPAGGFAPVPGPIINGYVPYASQGCPTSSPNVGGTGYNCQFWAHSSPLQAIQTLAPGAQVNFDSGLTPNSAATLAANSDVAIVFVHSWASENLDATSLSAASGTLGLDCSLFNSACVDQDQLVTTVAAANPKTIVVVESGSAILMPWLGNVGAVLEAWYPGIRGGQAIADLLFGVSNPSGKLPITFPLSVADLPRPVLNTLDTIDYFGSVDYNIEGQNVGYKWFDSQNKGVLFPFGHGLSYTTFGYSKIVTTPVVTDGTKPIRVSFWLTNTGNRAGAEVAQVYLGLPAAAGESPKRYVGSQKVFLQPGEKQKITITIDPTSAAHPLSYWNNSWKIANGQYHVYVGTSSRQILLTDVITIH